MLLEIHLTEERNKGFDHWRKNLLNLGLKLVAGDGPLSGFQGLASVVRPSGSGTSSSDRRHEGEGLVIFMDRGFDVQSGNGSNGALKLDGDANEYAIADSRKWIDLVEQE